MQDATSTEHGAGIQPQAGSHQYLTFILAGEEYGVDILRVQEIKGWTEATPIPNTPDYVLGVINLRGTVVPVVDLRRRFQVEEAAFGPTTVVIVLRIPGDGRERTVGIVVDAVSEVYNVSSEKVTPPPDFDNASKTCFVTGLAQVEDKMLILIDCENLLTAEADLAVH